MSNIHLLGPNCSNLNVVLEPYYEHLDNVESILKIDGKGLERSNMENPTLHYFYDNLRVELSAIVKYMEGQVAMTRGKLYKSYKENHSLALSERDINKYIDAEPSYLTMYELLLEVKEMYEKYQAICGAFQVRGYALNNITKIRIAAMEDVIL